MTKRYAILAVCLLSIGPARSDTPRPEVAPRAIAGDRSEPSWEERLTITVGQAKADMVGSDDRVLQAAVDYVARLGGGTVRVLPGTYRLRNSVFLRSHVRLVGSGAETVLLKEPSHTSKLAVGSDWYDQEITLTDPGGFRVGDGVCLRARNPGNGGAVVLKRTLVARSGARFKLDRALRENVWLQGEATATSVFPLLCGENIHDVAIEDIALDGNRSHNAHLDGNYSGCIFLQDCRDIAIRRVDARNNNGDGISWQICHDVRVEDCASHDHAGLGLHPGSGAQRSVIRANKLYRNDIGLFFCWGVRGSLAEKNLIEDNRSYGISIGHKDTDNLVRDNDVRRSGKAGILFRPERGAGFAPDRNRFERNRLVDNGPDAGAAIDVQGVPDGVILEANDIRDTRGVAQRIGIRIAASAGTIHLRDNTIAGVAKTVVDLRVKNTLTGIDDAVAAGIERGDLPGAVVLVLRGDQVLLRKAYGNRVRRPIPTLMTEDTVFDLASLTKPIVTALGILLLMQDGKLDVRDLLATHLPAFARKETETITLEQLLVHTSGFIADNPLADYQQGKEEAWRRLFALKPIQPPGSRFTYSDVNYLLLGAIIEKLSGVPLDEFARRRIFEPLGMKETGYRPGLALQKRAAPTEQRDGRWLAGEVHDPRAAALGGVAGHAGLFSTADDLAIFARMLLAGGKHDDRLFLQPHILRLYATGREVPTTKGPGLRTLGWDMDTGFSSNRGQLFPRGISFGHTGFTGTSLWLDPRSRSAVIFLSNRVHPDGKGNVTRLRGEVATLAAQAVSD